MAYQDRSDEAKPLFGRIFTYYVLGFGALSLLFFIAARPAVMILTQEPFHEAYVAVGPSATAQFLIGAHSVLLAGMYFARQVKYQAVVQALAAAASLGLNVVLIPVLGILGGAVALAAGFLVMVVGQHVWNVRRHYLAVEYDWVRVGRFTLVFVIYAAAFSWPRDFSLALEIVLSGVATLLLAMLLFGLTAGTERALLRSSIDRFLPARLGGSR
jgi:O-antigen/teichoic acid export membrane protein